MGSAPFNREVTLTLLRDRLAVLNRTVSNKRVDVLNRDQITESEVKVSVSVLRLLISWSCLALLNQGIINCKGTETLTKLLRELKSTLVSCNKKNSLVFSACL